MSNWQHSSIGSDNGLAPTRRHAIILNNDGEITDVYMRPQWVNRHLWFNSDNTIPTDRTTVGIIHIPYLSTTSICRGLLYSGEVPYVSICRPYFGQYNASRYSVSYKLYFKFPIIESIKTASMQKGLIIGTFNTTWQQIVWGRQEHDKQIVIRAGNP